MLAIDSDLLKNIVFVAVALLAWVVKVAVERKQGRDGPAPMPSGDEEAAAPSRRGARPDEVDVVIEKRPLAPTLRPKPRRRPRPRPAAPAEPPAREGVAPERVPATAGKREVGRLKKRHLEPALAEHLPGFDVRESISGAARRVRHGGALSRLGVPPGRNARNMLRAGILWSEVLGAPRGVSGPHRSPAARRLRP